MKKTLAKKVTCCFALLALVSGHAQAQELNQQQRINEAKNLLQTACLAGSNYEIFASANGEIEIKSLTPGGKGSVKVNVKDDPGAVGYLNEEIRKGVDREIRECMQPFISRILDIITGSQSLMKESPHRAISFLASTIERRRVDVFVTTTPAKLAEQYGAAALFEYDYWLEDFGRAWDHHFVGVPHDDETPDLTKQIIFDKNEFVGIRYSQTSRTSSNHEQCHMPFEIAWSSLEKKFNAEPKYVPGNVYDYNNSRRIAQATESKLNSGGVTAIRESSYYVERLEASQGQTCQDQVMAVID